MCPQIDTHTYIYVYTQSTVFLLLATFVHYFNTLFAFVPEFLITLIFKPNSLFHLWFLSLKCCSMSQCLQLLKDNFLSRTVNVFEVLNFWTWEQRTWKATEWQRPATFKGTQSFYKWEKNITISIRQRSHNPVKTGTGRPEKSLC